MTRASATATGQSERTCPYCAETIKAAAIRCRWCGADLTAPVPEGAGVGAPDPGPGTDPGTDRGPEPDTEPDTEPEAESEPGADAGPGRLDRLAGRPWVVGVLAVLVLLLGTVFVRMALVEAEDAPVTTGNSPTSAGATFTSEGAKSAGLSAATRATERVLSYDHQSLDQDVEAASRLLDAEMRQEYDDTMAAIADRTRKNKAAVQAVVVAASAISATEDDVRALLFVNQTTTGKHLEQPRVDLNRVVVSLHRDGGDWVVTDLDAL